MSQNLYLNPTTYDLDLTSTKNLRLTEDTGEYFSQKIENVLSMFQDEWYLDPSLGIPYYQDILKKQSDMSQVSNIFFNAISEINGVEEILTFEFEYDNTTREYSLAFTVRVDSGEIVTGEF